jgi:hypothetical protein
MIGCLILGTFVAAGAARLIRHRTGWAGPCGGHWRGGFGGHCGGGMHAFHRHGWGAVTGYGGWAPEPGDGYDPGLRDPFGNDGDHEFEGHRGWDRFGGTPSARGGGFVVGSIVRHVRATATQERVIRAAFDEFRNEMKDVGGGEGKRTRQDVGAALRKPHFDEVFMGELFARQDTAIERTRKAFVGLMARVHETLDEEQRGRLAELVEKGPRFWRRGFGW